MSTFRILPVVVLSLVVMFGMRSVELWTGYSTISAAQASDASAPAPARAGVTGAIEPAAPADSGVTPPPTPDAATAAAPTDGATAPSAPETAATPATEAATASAAPPPTLPPPSSDEAKDTNIPALSQPQTAAEDVVAAVDAKPAVAPAAVAAKRPKIPGEEDFMSASEIEVLQSLTKRREDLDKRSAELDMREKLLIATEQRLDQKLAEIKAVESQVNSVVHTLDENQQKQIASLVKVYENMKPKDAATIMQDLDKNILLEVAARMKEAKMAPILAAMEPSKAREVTVLLAKRNEIPGRSG